MFKSILNYSLLTFLAFPLFHLSACAQSDGAPNYIPPPPVPMTAEEAEEEDMTYVIESERWLVELKYNGDVGAPCGDNIEQWRANFPGFTWGARPLDARTVDVNEDGIVDLALFFFSPQNCIGSTHTTSDLGMLIYPDPDKIWNYLTNKNISGKIESKIGDALQDQAVVDIWKTNIQYQDVKEFNIIGSFQTWQKSDPNCCPSYQGTFNYNPVLGTIQIQKK